MVHRSVTSLLIVVVTSMVSLAAPPTVTGLFPAGGQRGTTFEIAASGTLDPWPAKVWASHPGIVAKAAAEKGKVTVAVAAETPLGVHYLRFHNKDGADALRPFVVGTLLELLEKEPNDSPSTAQVIEASAVVNGRLAKSGDVDCFAVTLKHGQTLIASAVANATLGSPMDSVLQIATPSGVVLSQNHDYRGLDPQIAFVAPSDGTYIVRYFAFPSQPDSSIRYAGGDGYIYRLTLTTGAFLDYARPMATSQQSNDSVALHGWNIPEVSRSIKLTAIDLPSSLLTVGNAPNAIALQREPHPCYDCTVTNSNRILEAPFTLTGRLDKPIATYAFRAIKGKALHIRLKVGTPDRVMTSTMRILDSEGKTLVRVEPPALDADCETTFVPPADGVYRLEVRDLYGKSGTRYVFSLRVVPSEPDFGMTVTADRFALTPGKPLDVPVTIVPKNGFKQDVVLNATNLPAGVLATTVLPIGKPSSVVTLRFTAEKSIDSFAFHIVGTVKGQAKILRVAGVVGTGVDGLNENLWLTVKE